jgi:hypothetical protein
MNARDLDRERRTVAACLAAVAQGTMTVGDETYSFDFADGRGRLTWNITQAKRCVALRQAHPPMEVPRTEMAKIAARFDYDEAYLSQVDITRPGIAAPYIDDGRIYYLLVDGVHRAMRAYREGARFWTQALTDEDNRACLLEAPPGVIP